MTGRGRFKSIDMWPESDAAQWRRGLSPASLLDPSGHTKSWRPATTAKTARAYASWLYYCEASDCLYPNESPEHRVTPERIANYRAFMERRLAPVTVRLRLTDLKQALSVIVPGATFPFLDKAISLYPKKGDASKKHARLVELPELLELGFELMESADRKRLPTRCDAVCFRDGLMIALLVHLPLRLRNLASIATARNLRPQKGSWVLDFPSAETKAHKSLITPWPSFIEYHLSRYLTIYRPLLLRGRKDEGHLWISRRPGALTENGIYYAITSRTKRKFGRSINPHLFRDVAMTFLTVHHPEDIHAGHHVLGNSFHIAQEFYNQARCIQASQNLNETLEIRRRRKKKKQR